MAVLCYVIQLVTFQSRISHTGANSLRLQHQAHDVQRADRTSHEVNPCQGNSSVCLVNTYLVDQDFSVRLLNS